MVEHKIVAGTPDEVCHQCPQLWQGECRAFSVPHSLEEERARSTGYGMECDPPRIKTLRREHYGAKYHTG